MPRSLGKIKEKIDLTNSQIDELKNGITDSNQSNCLKLVLDSYQLTRLLAEKAKLSNMNKSSIDKQTVLKIVAKHDDLILIHNKLSENLTKRNQFYLSLQFFITHFMKLGINYEEVKKTYETHSLPKSVKYYNLDGFLFTINNILGSRFEEQKVLAEIERYLIVKLLEQDKKISSNLINSIKKDKCIEKKQELKMDLGYLNQNLVSPKIILLTFQYIINHRLKLNFQKIEKKSITLFANNSTEFHLYNINDIMIGLNNILISNYKSAA